MFQKILTCSAFVFLAACSGEQVKKNIADTPVKDTAVVPPPVKTNLKPGLRYPFEIIKNNKTPFEDAVARWENHLYYCGYRGKVSMADTTGANRAVLFDIKAEFLVDKIFLLPYDSVYFVFWQETDHLGVKSYAGCFKRDSEKPEWKVTYKVPNIGPPVIDNRTVYVTAAGIISSIDLSNGNTNWKCDTLFSKYTMAFYKFERPRVYDSAVVFVESKTKARRFPDSLKVSVRTGRQVK